MRERWFADDRDLVKWATLAALAERHGLGSITQVAYRRASETVPTIEIDGTATPVGPHVWKFFRHLARIRELGQDIGVAIDVVDEVFAPNQRKAYLDAVLHHLSGAARPRLVFLDPDTGLQPDRPSAEHTTRDEVVACWAALRSGEWLVLYQHARRTKTWIDDVSGELRALCGEPPITLARSRDVGKDVVFFCARKP